MKNIIVKNKPNTRLHSAGRTDHQKSLLSHLRSVIRRIRSDKDLSPDEKDRQIDKIRGEVREELDDSQFESLY